jgi:hypothetical protein
MGCSAMRQQLERKGVTLRLLWREYCGQHPDELKSYRLFYTRIALS